jgi:hypothetical protein
MWEFDLLHLIMLVLGCFGSGLCFGFLIAEYKFRNWYRP